MRRRRLIRKIISYRTNPLRIIVHSLYDDGTKTEQTHLQDTEGFKKEMCHGLQEIERDQIMRQRRTQWLKSRRKMKRNQKRENPPP